MKYVGVVDSPGEWHVEMEFDKGRALLSPEPSLRLANHSPDGFSWGYGGSGPAQLALAILYDVTSDARLSLSLYQDFKRDVVSKWDMDKGWEMTLEEVRQWIRENNGQPYLS